MKKLIPMMILLSTISCAYKPIELKNQIIKDSGYCISLGESISERQSIYSLVPKEYQDKYDERKQLIFTYNLSEFLQVSKDCGSKSVLINNISSVYKMIGDTGQAAHQITLEFELSINSQKIKKIAVSDRSPYYSSFTHTKSKKQTRMSKLLLNVFEKLTTEISNL